METETTPPATGRPRPLLLIMLGLAVIALAMVKLMPSGSTTAARPTSNQPGPSATTGTAAPVDPKDLDVRLEGLETARPEPSGASRNPFGFAPKTSPPPVERTTPPPVVLPPPVTGGADNVQPEGPPPPPPIPLKYLGLIEGQGKKLAALSDCKFTYRGEEGEIVDGRYRLVKIQVESVVMEYVDGRGRTTIRLSGQDCVGR